MNLYIRSTGMISPQPLFGAQAPDGPALAPKEGMLRCVEPDYAQFLDPRALRRMSRIIRMGVTAGLDCLKAAGVKEPDAIITGTAYGCLEDTEIFLKKMIENQETLLTPTAFIQSTHNTVGAQIALLLGCHHYNNTFVHRGLSFENALLDASLLIREGEAQQVLVGAVDEITAVSHTILQRFGLYRHRIAGEGAAFFLLSKKGSPGDKAVLLGMDQFYGETSPEKLRDRIGQLLHAAGLDWKSINHLFLGESGDPVTDKLYEGLKEPGKEITPFKTLCGEYPTASAFALGLACRRLAEEAAQGRKKTVLIYNQYLGIYHGLFLLSTC